MPSTDITFSVSNLSNPFFTLLPWTIYRTRKTPPVSLNDIDCFPNSANQEDVEALPSSVQLRPSKSVENPSTTNTLPVQGSIDSVVSTDNRGNYAKWKKLTLVVQSIYKFRSLKAEKIKSEVKTSMILNISLSSQ